MQGRAIQVFQISAKFNTDEVMLKLSRQHKSHALKSAFSISRGTKTHADVVEVSLKFFGHQGVGEGVPYPRYGESVQSCLDALTRCDGFPAEVEVNLTGAARCAFDCALWDLRAKIAGVPVWQLAKLKEPQPVRTAQTLSLGTAAQMAEAAGALGENALIKMKLGGTDDLAAIAAVRATRPQADIIVDANEGWSLDDYHALIPRLVEANVKMIEQPFPEGDDAALRGLDRPIPICADESVHTSEDVVKLRGLYDVLNIKLDKTGGLTEAIKLRAAIQEAGLAYMVGCMVGSSLSMAPAQLIADGAMFVDLDGPLWLAEDREPAIEFDNGIMYPAQPELWG